MFFPSTSRLRLELPTLVIGTVICILQSAACGQDPYWGNKMFELTDIRFGSVAKGADSAVQVKVKNVYKEDIQITNLTTGCGCVSWDEVKNNQLPLVVPSGQSRLITLRLNTIQFDGERKSNAKVMLLDPVHSSSATVEFPVTAYIRRDVVITPGAVHFGTVDQGSTVERKVDVNYAGRDDWRITQAKGNNPNVVVTLREAGRGNGLVKYELIFTLKAQAPQGVLRDQVILMTDDVNNPQVPIMVEGTIETDVAITDIQFGTMTPGQSKPVNLVIRGKKPIKIDELYREKKETSKIQDESFKVKLDTVTAKPVHVLPITFTAPDVTGAFEEEFVVKIAGRPQPLSFKARGRVVEQAGAAKQ
jgi:hypothetical protein